MIEFSALLERETPTLPVLRVGKASMATHDNGGVYSPFKPPPKCKYISIRACKISLTLKDSITAHFIDSGKLICMHTLGSALVPPNQSNEGWAIDTLNWICVWKLSGTLEI